MDYQITIKSNNGSIAVTATGDVPDGEHVISGHEDDILHSLQCERKDELGHLIIRTRDGLHKAHMVDTPVAQASFTAPLQDDDPNIAAAMGPE
jgi:hypothetical protein